MTQEVDHKSDTKQAFVEKLEARIDQWEARVKQLRAQAQEAQADSKLALDREIKDLSDRLNDLRAKVNEVKDAGGDAWRDLASGCAEAWDRFKVAAELAADRFK